MNHKLNLFSLILSSLFLFSCVHFENGKVVFKKSPHHSKKICSYDKKDKNWKKSCCGKKACEHGKKSCSRKSIGSKDSCKRCGGKDKACKKWGKKCRTSKKCNSCHKRGTDVGLALVKGFNNNITGSVSFERAGYKKLQLIAQVEGLKPKQNFGFHVHEFGNCEEKGIMAGGHLNPGNQKHGGLKSEERHLGDLGNLSSDKNGKAQVTALLNGKLKMFMGRSIIIHESEDDLKSQPTGNAGKRIACGIIGAALLPFKLEKDEAVGPAEMLTPKTKLEKREAVSPEIANLKAELKKKFEAMASKNKSVQKASAEKEKPEPAK